MIGLLVLGLLQLMPILPPGETGRETITINSFATTQSVIRLAASIGFFLLAAGFINTDRRRNVAVNTILLGCVVIALVGIGQSFIGKALWQRGTFGPFVNRNHFAGFMVMGVGLAGGMLIGRSVRRELLAVYGSVLLLLSAGVLVSASRGGVLALGAEILFLALVALPIALAGGRRSPGWRPLVLRALGALLIGGGAIVGSLFLVGSEGLVRNLSQTAGEIDGQLPLDERYSRRDIWLATSRIVADHPWFGVGLGAFPFAYTRYDQSSGAQRVEQTHNDYLQILVDAGIVGGLLTVVFVILFFVSAFRSARTHHRRRRSIVLGALSGCFAIAIHSFVDFNLQVTANAQLFLTLLALTTPTDDTLS
ncbi:MAG: O-antigen ligase family protein [Blastocatellia bacterium]